MAMNRFLKNAMKQMGGAGGAGGADVAGALRKMMGQGDRVKTVPHSRNPSKPRNYSTDAATGRHRSISNKTADRYASYGKTKAKNNAMRTGTAGAAVAAMAASKGSEQEAMAEEERNPAEEPKKTAPKKKVAENTDKKKKKKAPVAKKKDRGGKEASKASFDTAFAAARRAYKSGRTDSTKFTWRGKSYSIVTKDDIKKAGSKDLRSFLNKGGKPKR